MFTRWLTERNKPLDIKVDFPDGPSLSISGELPEKDRREAVDRTLALLETKAHEAVRVSEEHRFRDGTEIVVLVHAQRNHEVARVTLTRPSDQESVDTLE